MSLKTNRQFGNLFALLTAFVLPTIAYSDQNPVQKYGCYKGEPIDSGYFFYDSEYIEAPYIVERQGLDVFINDKKVYSYTEPEDWRITDDPGPVPENTVCSSDVCFDPANNYRKYWGLKYRYLRTHYDDNEANSKYIETIESVSSVNFVEMGIDNHGRKVITVYFCNGETRQFDLQLAELMFPSISYKTEVINECEKHRLSYETKLKKHLALFSQNNSECRDIPAVSLFKVGSIILENEKPQNRIKALDENGFKSLTIEPWKAQICSIKYNEQLADRIAQIPELTHGEKTDPEKFGCYKGQPIDSGYFFYDSEYIEAPYIVERQGLDVFINDKKVHSGSKPQNWRITDDPGPVPDDVIYSSDFDFEPTGHPDEYWNLKCRYLQTIYQADEANAKYIDCIKTIPGVERVEISSDDILGGKRVFVYFSDGSVSRFNTGMAELGYPTVPYDIQVTKGIEKKRLFFEKRLKRRNAFFYWNRGGEIYMSAAALEVVGGIILEFDKPEDRVEALRKSGFEQYTKGSWKTQLCSIKYNEQLAKRITEVPIRIKEHRFVNGIKVSDNLAPNPTSNKASKDSITTNSREKSPTEEQFVPNLRRTNHKRIADKSIPQLVAEVGDPWSASSFRAGVTYDLSNDAWLYLSFENNLRVKQLIELGRKNPEYVGGLVSKDLIRRKSEWIATAEAYYDSDKKGYLVGDDGSIVGNKSALKYEEDTYAIEADIFILMNIDYTKGLDSLAEYCVWRTGPHTVKKQVELDDGTTIVKYEVLATHNEPNKNNLNDTVLLCSVAHLLQNCNNEKFAEAKNVMDEILTENRCPLNELPTALKLSGR